MQVYRRSIGHMGSWIFFLAPIPYKENECQTINLYFTIHANISEEQR